MRKEEVRSMWVAVILLAIILLMSIGFAAYAATLNIGGTNNVTVKKAVWDVHWNPAFGTSGITERTGTGYVDVTGADGTGNPTVTNTDVTFAATLTKPGDKAEFTVQAKNFGTIDAKLNKITMSDLSSYKYIKYTVNYANTDYTATTDNLNVALNAEATADVKVTLEYVYPTNEADLPTASDVTVTATANFDYVQADV